MHAWAAARPASCGGATTPELPSQRRALPPALRMTTRRLTWRGLAYRQCCVADHGPHFADLGAMTFGRLTLGGIAIALAVSGCSSDGSSDDETSIDAVTTIPAGDAAGKKASGTYSIELYTSACSGRCSAPTQPWEITFCDVGNRDDETIEVAQDDGELRIDGDDDGYVSRLDGGINVDGTFDVGGHATNSGGAVRSTARVDGMLEDDGSISALVTARVWGEVDGHSVNCAIEYELEGERVHADDHDDDDG